MGLCLPDCKRGTIVDHRRKVTYQDVDGGRVRIGEERRDPIRRGIIVDIEGWVTGTDGSVNSVTVQFRPDQPPEKVGIEELDRVYKASHRVAREAMRRLSGVPRDVGREFSGKEVSRHARISDPLGLTNPGTTPRVVLPSEDVRRMDEALSPMGLKDLEEPGSEPLVAPDAPEPKE